MSVFPSISRAVIAASMIGVNISLTKIAHNTSRQPIVNVFIEDDGDDDDDDEYDASDDSNSEGADDDVKPTSDIK